MWIQHIAYADATGRLKLLYDRVKGPDDNVDNIMLAHSLRAHSMEGHMALYKNVLHHASNTTPKWFLETVGVYVSHLNACRYCVEHHFSGLQRLLKDAARGDRIRAALESGALDASVFDDRQRTALAYAAWLTRSPADSGALQEALAGMRSAGWDDGGMLEINQVAAYFNYANRTVQGLGINTDGDILGLSPGNAADNADWSHR